MSLSVRRASGMYDSVEFAVDLSQIRPFGQRPEPDDTACLFNGQDWLSEPFALPSNTNAYSHAVNSGRTMCPKFRSAHG